MYKWNYRIRYSECDPAGRLGMSGVLALFQDVGYRHAEDAGRGIAFTKRTGLSAYLLSWHIEVLRAPLVGEETELCTWFSCERGPLTEKSIAMRAQSGELLAAGHTRWVLMDVKIGSPAPKQRRIWENETLMPPIPLSAVPRRIAIPPNGVLRAPITVRYRDTDTNRHLNNVRFVRLGAEAAGLDLDGVRSLSAEYLREAHEGDVLIPRISVGAQETAVSLERDGQAAARFVFRM